MATTKVALSDAGPSFAALPGGVVRIALPLSPYADDLWSDMFGHAALPESLTESGLDIVNASRTLVWADISAAMPNGAVWRLLDWMKKTVEEVNVARASLAADHTRIEEQAGKWWQQGVSADERTSGTAP